MEHLHYCIIKMLKKVLSVRRGKKDIYNPNSLLYFMRTLEHCWCYIHVQVKLYSMITFMVSDKVYCRFFRHLLSFNFNPLNNTV